MSSGLESEVKKETPQEIKKENGINERLPTNFPEGLRVMLIEDDPVLRQHVETLLKELLYQVITYDGAAITLSTLQARKNNFDIVLCSVHTANMDGLELLNQILAEMDIPVVMMSNEDVTIVKKCVTEGACDCLIKPIERKDLMPIFQHVMRKRMVEHSNDLKSTDASDVSVPLGKSRTSKRKKINGESINKDGDSIDMSMAKKQRVVWTDELIRKFNAVVEKIGIESKLLTSFFAVPKKILELMNVPWLTRENVASHLQ
ncbi:hypothetical protein MKW94_018541, partial [Papaver nudicaule]|nr:hypothetical protein [Papaver nudicaule]